jgi:hypothetical protein
VLARQWVSEKTDLLLEKAIGRPRGPVSPGGEHVMEAASHGVFDNDIEGVSRTLARITGRAMQTPVL